MTAAPPQNTAMSHHGAVADAHASAAADANTNTASTGHHPAGLAPASTATAPPHSANSIATVRCLPCTGFCRIRFTIASVPEHGNASNHGYSVTSVATE